MPPTSRGVFGSGRNAFRTREKYLILLVLTTFGFFCFGAIFFLPDKGTLAAGDEVSMNKVYRVYKGIQEAGRDFMLPPPPIVDPQSDGANLNFHHGVIDRPDPHRLQDKAKLLAQVELDAQVILYLTFDCVPD